MFEAKSTNFEKIVTPVQIRRNLATHVIGLDRMKLTLLWTSECGIIALSINNKTRQWQAQAYGWHIYCKRQGFPCQVRSWTRVVRQFHFLQDVSFFKPILQNEIHQVLGVAIIALKQYLTLDTDGNWKRKKKNPCPSTHWPLGMHSSRVFMLLEVNGKWVNDSFSSK